MGAQNATSLAIAALALLWLGLAVSLRSWNKHSKIFAAIVFAIAASLLIPAARAAYEPRHLLWNSRQNINDQVAEAFC